MTWQLTIEVVIQHKRVSTSIGEDDWKELQLEGIASLQYAVAVKDIQGSNSTSNQLGKRPQHRSNAGGSTSRGEAEKAAAPEQASGKPPAKKRFDGSMEYWSCGATWHFKSQCPRKNPTSKN